MMSEDDTQPICLDVESRVRGVCQLMDGVIFSLRVTNSGSEADITIAIKQFNKAMQLLNKYHLMGERLLKKCKRLKKIDEMNAKRYQKIIRKKEKEVIKILGNECKIMGMSPLEDFCK